MKQKVVILFRNTDISHEMIASDTHPAVQWLDPILSPLAADPIMSKVQGVSIDSTTVNKFKHNTVGTLLQM